MSFSTTLLCQKQAVRCLMPLFVFPICVPVFNCGVLTSTATLSLFKSIRSLYWMQFHLPTHLFLSPLFNFWNLFWAVSSCSRCIPTFTFYTWREISLLLGFSRVFDKVNKKKPSIAESSLCMMDFSPRLNLIMLTFASIPFKKNQLYKRINGI